MKKSYAKKIKQQYVQQRRKFRKTEAFPYSKPRRIHPMLAEQGTQEDIERLHGYDEQRKYDGTRTFIIKDGDKVVLRGRSWINDYAPKFPELVNEVRQLPVEACVLDSELTFFKRGTDKDMFVTALANPETKKDYTAKLMVFDALFVEDHDLKQLPFSDRREILEKLIPSRLKHIEAVETIEKDKKAYFQSLKQKHGEGVMLKERKSPYREGKRTREWLKIKHWKCVTGDTLVTMDDGSQKEIKDVQEGDEVYSFDVKGVQKEYHGVPIGLRKLRSRVRKKYSYNIDGEILEITVGKRKLRITSNHHVFTDRGWILASELQIGDRMLQCGVHSEELRKLFRGHKFTREERVQAGKIIGKRHPGSGFLDSIRPKAIQASLSWRQQHREEFLANCSKAGKASAPYLYKRLQKWREEKPAEFLIAQQKAWNKPPEERRKRAEPLVKWAISHKGEQSNIMKWKLENTEIAREVSSENMAYLRRKMAEHRTKSRQEWLSEGQRYLWGLLDGTGIVYTKEYPMPYKRTVQTRLGRSAEIIYHFNLDVALVDKKVNIEYDGDPTHYSEKGMQKDAERDSYLRTQGWTVFRIRFDKTRYGREENRFLIQSLRQLPEAIDEILGMMTLQVKNPFSLWQKVINIKRSRFSGVVYDLEVENSVHNYLANGLLISNSDEAVIVGYTQGEGARASTFGAVILAQKDKDGKWRYVGKTSGFSEKELARLLKKMRHLETNKPPIVDAPSDINVKAWVKPEIVAEVKYYEKTESGSFRFPDYVRERDDKKPEECRL